MISKIRKYHNTEKSKTVIHSCVTSQLDQNNSLLLGLPKQPLSPLQRVQSAAVTMILGLKKREHIAPALKSLHWLPVEKRILYKVLLIYKCLNNKGPAYLQDLLHPYVPPQP